MLWPLLKYLKTFFSRALKTFISKTQRTSFWFCLRTKNLFQMSFLNDYSSNIVLTRVTSDLSIFKCFPKIISLKTRFIKWITFLLVWPWKTFPKDFISLNSLKINWNDPCFEIESEYGSFNFIFKEIKLMKSFGNVLQGHTRMRVIHLVNLVLREMILEFFLIY